MMLTRKLLNQGILVVESKSSLLMFYGRHHDLIDCYGVSVLQMTTDMFRSLFITTRPFLNNDLSPGL